MKNATDFLIINGVRFPCPAPGMQIVHGEIIVPKVAPEYYATPEFTLIDSLNKIGADSSFKHRTKIAKANNIQNYVGSAEQNLLMLKL